MDFEKALYSVEESIEKNGGVLPLSKSCVYKLIRKKEIPGRRIGNRVFIPGSYLRTLIMDD